MAIEAIKGAAMTYQGSVSTAEVREIAKPKVEAGEVINISESISRNTSALDTKQASGEGAGGGQQQMTPEQQAAQLKKAVEDINKRANNSEAIFGIHEKTNRVTIKLIDKDTKELIKELPPEKTLDMIAKVWEMAGLLVDEKR
ncbi:MAG: flagellar protein FlaG [Muribaculaceae bacterium]|nr:flagellar protein FlaG [Roseburia sp.]MCM1429869.1 flagellar protein FlaG [Muribaculaceae bacterium]MCM1492920.1 flagellar protein FlaG [Muribaculaceae bacterium]